MRHIKSVLEAILGIVVLLAAFAGILSWLSITPKEVTRHMTWPHWAWLALGLGLFAINMYWTSRAFKLKWENEELRGKLHDIAAEHLLNQDPQSGWARSEESNLPDEKP
jgi:hypothetical protein